MPLIEKCPFRLHSRPKPERVANGFLHPTILPERVDMSGFRAGFLPALKDGASARDVR